MVQEKLFTDKVEFIAVPSVIGSGYESDVAKLAVEDGVAYRAARKNMQIHSAIILKLNDEFSGFFTFQVNHEAIAPFQKDTSLTWIHSPSPIIAGSISTR